MALPSLYSISTGKSIQTAFGGLNESYACAEAEFTEMKNFSSRGYPALQTRTPRRTMRAMGRCNGMYHLNGLLLCEGTTLRYTEDSEDDVATAAAGGEIVLENAVTDSEKIMIGMGTKILIWPDAKSFDTATGKLEALSAAWSQTGTVTIAPCDAGGKTYTVSSVGTTEPSGPADGTLFLKQNSSSSKWAYVNVLEQYDAKSGKWAEILLNSVKMTLPGLAAAGFRKGDTITVEQVPGLVEEYLAEGVNGEVTIEQMDGDSIVLTGSPKTGSTRYYGSFTVTAGGTTWKSMNGSESATAGNALRCMGKYLYDNGLVKKEDMRIETGAGVREVHLYTANGLVTSACVDMGRASLDAAAFRFAIAEKTVVDYPVYIGGQSFNITCVDVGEPHCVAFCPRIDDVDVEFLGPRFEQAPYFPERINAEFIRVVNPSTIKMRVWERGSGEIMASGTGACAAVVAAVANGMCEKGRDVTVRAAGGDLVVNYTDEKITLTGDAKLVYTGEAVY